MPCQAGLLPFLLLYQNESTASLKGLTTKSCKLNERKQNKPKKPYLSIIVQKIRSIAWERKKWQQLPDF